MLHGVEAETGRLEPSPSRWDVSAEMLPYVSRCLTFILSEL